MKRTEAKSIATIIEEALQTSGLDSTAREYEAARMWEQVVGPGITRYTARRWVDHGVMHVYLTSGPLKNELSFHRERLVRAINEAVGGEAITDIKFH